MPASRAHLGLRRAPSPPDQCDAPQQVSSGVSCRTSPDIAIDFEWHVDTAGNLFEMHLEIFLTAWRRHFPSWWQEEARKMEQLER